MPQGGIEPPAYSLPMTCSTTEPLRQKFSNNSYDELDQLSSSKSLEKQFKRTISRLYELTSVDYKK